MNRLKKCWQILEQLIGEGEYARYCAHLRARHPDRPLPSAAEYYRSRMEEKYTRPNRCC